MKTFQELADEAFGDLLKKHNRPINLKDALRMSAGHSATVHQLQKEGARKALEGANVPEREVSRRGTDQAVAS